MKLFDAHDLFLEYQEAKEQAKGTLVAYNLDARCFYRFLVENYLLLVIK
ncbi:hypothetical protein V6C27_08180 [Peptococcaceae bacterium 1198_IL3148]